MANKYADSTVAGPGAGTIGDPFKRLSSVVLGAGETLFLKCGSVFRETLPAASIAAATLTVTSYGTGALPIICGSDIVTNWTRSPDYPTVFYYDLGSATGGNVSENGEPMACVFWTDLATTAPLIPDGGYSYDWANRRVYINPTFGKVVDITFEVSTRLYGIQSTAAFAALTISGVEFRGQSRNAIDLQNRTTTIFDLGVMRQIGGHTTDGVTYVGNGFQVSGGCNSSSCRNSLFEDIFDSPITPQLFSNSQVLNGFTAYGNTINRCGFFGVEVTITLAPTNCTLANIDIHDNVITLAGDYKGRPKTVTGRGLHVGGPQATSEFTNVTFRNNTLIDCYWGMSDDLRTTGTVANVVFSGNVVSHSNTPANGRGIYTCSNVVYTDNTISGYTYGVGVFGSAAGVYTPQINDSYFLNVSIGVLSFSSAGTTTLQVRRSTFMPATQFYSEGISNMTFDMGATNFVRAGVVAGTSAAVTALNAGGRLNLPADYV